MMKPVTLPFYFLSVFMLSYAAKDVCLLVYCLLFTVTWGVSIRTRGQKDCLIDELTRQSQTY